MDTFTLLSWNIRGLNNSRAKRNLKRTIQQCKPCIIFIQESKCGEISVNQKDSMWEDTNKWIESPAEGQSRGLIISWDDTKFELTNQKIQKHWIYMRGNLHMGDKEIMAFHNFINIYAPQKTRDKRKLWEELQHVFNERHDEPFCVGGDMNSIIEAVEAENCQYRISNSRLLATFLSNNNLGDVTGVNYKFTWFGPERKKSRLDRILIHAFWNRRSEWKIQGMCRKSSDHLPLLLYFKHTDWGPKPIKAFNCWLERHDFNLLLDGTM